MPNYTLTHPSASATRNIMEHAVTRHGNIRVYHYEPARLFVEASDETIKSFHKTYPAWFVDTVINPGTTDPQPAATLEEQRAARKREWRRLGF